VNTTLARHKNAKRQEQFRCVLPQVHFGILRVTNAWNAHPKHHFLIKKLEIVSHANLTRLGLKTNKIAFNNVRSTNHGTLKIENALKKIDYVSLSLLSALT